MSNLSDKIELQTGVPVTAVFAFDQGKLCSKRWPGAEDCYARQTNDGRVLFVDAAEEMRLRKTVRAGQPVILCREETKAGAKYRTIKTPAPELKAPLGVVNGIPDSKYASTTPEPINGASAAPGRDGQAFVSSGGGGLLGRCLIEALEACKAAQAHATAIGLPTTFSSGDIERMGVSIFIERTRNGSVVERTANGADPWRH